VIAQIEEFRFNQNAWRIAWIGRIDYSREPQISVYLSEIDAKHQRPLSNDALIKPEHHRVAWVRVGLLPLLKIGSIWIDGVMTPPLRPLDEGELDLRHDQIELTRFGGSIEVDGKVSPLLPAWRYKIGLAASNEVAGSWVAVVHNPVPEIRFVVIPSTVLFQACMATSPKAIQRLVFGQLGSIADLEDSGFFQQSPDTFRITLFKDFRDSEAPTLASLLADPVGRAAFRGFRQTLIAESVNFDRSRSGGSPNTHIKLGLPFQNPAYLKVRGKFLPVQDRLPQGSPQQWGFLVTEILDLHVRLVFDQLVIDRKNDGKKGENADDQDLPYAFKPSTEEASVPTDPLLPVTSAQDPIQFLDKLSLEASAAIHPIGLERIFEPKDVQQYRAWPLVAGNPVEHDGSGATGDPSGEAQGPAELDIVLGAPPKFPVSLEHFLQTLEGLEDKGLAFRTLAISSARRQVGKHTVNYMPRNIKGVRSWHLAAEGANPIPRGYVVAETKRGDTWHYLIELERKGKETLAVAHIRHHAGAQIEEQRFHYFMNDVAKANGWTAVEGYKMWVYQPIRHTPSRDLGSFVTHIYTKLR
jgi:hypothetical protein